jgi:transglutaminase-like putative cysteine protease
MTIQVALFHETRYRFARPVILGPHVVRLRPAPHTRTRILGYSLDIGPAEHRLHWQQDPFGNWQARLFFLEPADHLTVTVDLLAEMAVVDPFDFYLEPEASTWPFAYDPALLEDLGPYLEVMPPGPLFQALLASIPRDPVYTVTFLVELNLRLASLLGHVVRLEPGIQSLGETLALGRGRAVIRAGSWCSSRHLGIAARFVSGYLISARHRSGGGRAGRGHRRSPCLGRALPAGRGLDRPRPTPRASVGEVAYPARGIAAAGQQPPITPQPPSCRPRNSGTI